MTIVINDCCSTTSRCVLIPFEWYGCPMIDAQKSSSNTFPIHISRKNWMKYVYKYLKTKIFLRDTNVLPQMHWTSNIFWHPVTTIGCFWVSLNYSILNFKKTVCPKNVWMHHCIVFLVVLVERWFYLFR